MTTSQAHPQEPQWDTGYGGGYSGYHEGGSYYPSQGYPKPRLRAGTFASARYLDMKGCSSRNSCASDSMYLSKNAS
jgi:hypothetical protein